MLERIHPTLAACVLALLLAACGGGGDAGTATAEGQDASASAGLPVAAPFARLWTQGGVYTATWRDPAAPASPAFELQVRYTPSADAPFEGTTRKSVTQLLTFRVAGNVIGTDVTTLFFSNVGSLQWWGSTNLGGPYTVADAGAALPDRRAPGTQGVIGGTQVWADSSKLVASARGAMTWSVDRIDDATGWTCLNTTLTLVQPASGSNTESTCLRVNAAGEIAAMRVTLTLSDGRTLTFQ